jgi:hypothetical protein
MSKDMQRPTGCIRTVAMVLLLLLTIPVAAEVGVVFDPGQGSSAESLYELVSIIEDADPVGIHWRPYATSAPNRVLLNIDGETNGDGRPSSLYNKFSHLPMVAWAKSTASGFDVVISHFANGVWSSPLVLCEDATTTLDAEPYLVMNPADGSVHLLYWMDQNSPRIMHRQAPADLSSWSAPVQISDIGDVALRPAGVFHQGGLTVTYEAHAGQAGGTPRYIMLATEDGGSYSSEVLANTDHDKPNRPRVHSARGRLWVDWIDAEGEMTWTSRLIPDPWGPIEPKPFSSNEERDYHVRGEIESLALE